MGQLAHRRGLGLDRPADRLFSVLSIGHPRRRQPGLVIAFLSRKEASETFVTRAQLRRVMAVFVPTLLFCLATQFLGLYVASFFLIAAFMRMVGKIALWKSLLTAFVFTAVMFVTFDIAFDVIMPKGPLEAAFGY
jgi:hypothetical protein